MLILEIREDLIFLSEEFYDEDLKPVKIMTGHDIQMMGGKLFPKLWKMRRTDTADEFTELYYHEVRFDVGINEDMFTMSSLKIHAR